MSNAKLKFLVMGAILLVAATSPTKSSPVIVCNPNGDCFDFQELKPIVVVLQPYEGIILGTNDKDKLTLPQVSTFIGSDGAGCLKQGGAYAIGSRGLVCYKYGTQQRPPKLVLPQTSVTDYRGTVVDSRVATKIGDCIKANRSVQGTMPNFDCKDTPADAAKWLEAKRTGDLVR